MKKSLAILLLLIYSLPLLSNNCQLHYCGGKLKKVSFFAVTKKSCCGGKKMPKGCCKDVQLLCKADKHEVTSAPKVSLQKDVQEISPSVIVLNIIPVTSLLIPKVTHDPPDIQGVQLRLLNGNFRI